MLEEPYLTRISSDFLWRERELRSIDRMLLKEKSEITIKSAILLTYSHWEGHFKLSATELLEFVCEAISRKAFKWTDLRPEVRQRLLFCSYRKTSLAGQSQETFISYLNALNDARFAKALNAKTEIIMTDDNLSTVRADAICQNLGLKSDWFILKKVIIDERILDHRNAIAHGARFLRSGDAINTNDPVLLEALEEGRGLIRETRNQFQNAIINRVFLIQANA